MPRFLHKPPVVPQLPQAKSQSLTTPASFTSPFPFLRHAPARLPPSPRPLHLSFYLPTMLFSQTSAALTPSLPQVTAQISFSPSVLPHPHYVKLQTQPPHCTPYSSSLLYFSSWHLAPAHILWALFSVSLPCENLGPMEAGIFYHYYFLLHQKKSLKYTLCLIIFYINEWMKGVREGRVSQRPFYHWT